jgi:hypothetical protein
MDSELIGFLTQEFRQLGGRNSGHRKLLTEGFNSEIQRRSER